MKERATFGCASAAHPPLSKAVRVSHLCFPMASKSHYSQGDKNPWTYNQPYKRRHSRTLRK